MQKQQIKQKLKNYLETFKQEKGGFKSLEVIYEYINFLKSEKYTKELLKDTWKYAEEQKNILTSSIDDIKKEDLVLDPKNLLNSPIFKKEMKISQERIDNEEEVFNTSELVPVMLTSLMTTCDMMSSIKNNELSDSLKQIKDLDISSLLCNAKNMTMGFQNMEVLPDKNVTIENSQFHEASIEIVNKYIIDQIDSEEFLTKGESKSKLSFDKKKSELNIYGDIVKIQLKSDKPNDHYILEYLFEQENIFDEADFRDIAETKLSMTEYDSSKDWNVLRHACDNLNKKIAKATNEKEKEFLIYTTGKTGYCKINPKYL